MSRVTGLVGCAALVAAVALSGCGAASIMTRDAETSTVTTTTQRTTPVAVPTRSKPIPTTTQREPSDPLSRSVKRILTDIDRFWEGGMGLGSNSVTFSVAEFDSRTEEVPICGVTRYDVAGYCEQGDKDMLMWDRAAFADKEARGGDMAMAVTLAHEYGHAVQDFMGRFHGNRFVEVQADCLSGVYMSANLDKYGSLDDLVRRALPTSPIGQKPAREKAFKEGFAEVPDKLEHCLAYQG
ncbi:neutral zinc metallopeptidase [Mycolicibacterium lutetiense]|uniref:Metalloprotease n=1 Tax=Mycolicibacterium lutetiense TaxID=1641992 RepID=A0ABS4ZSM5_9MYCO|nr:neutral zinc metallopeptidase [Mycolicibacterium lutetiense]MBP2452489.1 putative metalloprotease [Mycolicibacterium lutetiense]